jgi:Fungal hydrophobin
MSTPSTKVSHRWSDRPRSMTKEAASAGRSLEHRMAWEQLEVEKLAVITQGQMRAAIDAKRKLTSIVYESHQVPKTTILPGDTMKKNPFIRVCMYFATLTLGVVFAGCIADPVADPVADPITETAIASQDVLVGTTSSFSCGAGSLQCCSSIQSASNPVVAMLASLLGISIPPTAVVGLTCTPSSGACDQQPACCTGPNFGGLLVVGCTPAS